MNKETPIFNTKGVRMERNGPMEPWSKWCEKWGHYFRPDATCVCGVKKNA